MRLIWLQVISIWECEYNEMRKSSEITSFLEKYYQNGRPSERLAKRAGLRGKQIHCRFLCFSICLYNLLHYAGGRTESFQMMFAQALHKDRELSYTDINSLYPHSSLNNGNDYVITYICKSNISILQTSFVRRSSTCASK